MAFGFGRKNYLDLPDQVCPDCGLKHMRRLHRKGFWETRILPLLGYYPWECPLCREPYYLKKRHAKKRT